ncbi:MAG: hypothetical protein DCC71_06015 [Proteobacteria bacterium]|nr:MAG: hypothetical protein DCC71_06015 [Pseudomonadota bacterium]
MSAKQPRIFAGFVRSSLDTLDRIDAALGARVRAKLAPETARALAEASSVSYVPVEVDVDVTECLFAEAGSERGCEVMRENLELTFESPLLSALVSGGLRLLGRSPARLLGWSAKFWGQLYRDAGTMAFEADGPSSGHLRLTGLPACIAASRPYLLGMAASLGAAFEAMGVDGEASVAAADPAAGTASIRVSWKA